MEYVCLYMYYYFSKYQGNASNCVCIYCQSRGFIQNAQQKWRRKLIQVIGEKQSTMQQQTILLQQLPKLLQGLLRCQQQPEKKKETSGQGVIRTVNDKFDVRAGKQPHISGLIFT